LDLRPRRALRGTSPHESGLRATARRSCGSRNHVRTRRRGKTPAPRTCPARARRSRSHRVRVFGRPWAVPSGAGRRHVIRRGRQLVGRHRPPIQRKGGPCPRDDDTHFKRRAVFPGPLRRIVPSTIHPWVAHRPACWNHPRMSLKVTCSNASPKTSYRVPRDRAAARRRYCLALDHSSSIGV
jgi:hypothetical protein